MTAPDDVISHTPAEPSPNTQERSRAIARTWRAARGIARDPAGTASLMALLIGVILSLLPEPKAWGTSIHNVGYGLVGGAAFSFIYQFWANDALASTIANRVRNSQERLLEDIRTQWDIAMTETKSSVKSNMSQLVQMHKRHWPLAVYPEGNVPNPEFNHRLESDLRQASRYDFRGQTGKHLASRLFSANYPKLRLVRVIIEDPTISDVMDARIDEKRFNATKRYASISNEEFQQIILGDLLDSLLGLYSVRMRFERIDVVYATRPTDVRIEVVEGVVYISPFVGKRPKGHLYPEVFRYDPQSVPGEVATLEFNREFDLLSDKGMQFHPRTSVDHLLAHLRGKGWDLSPAELDSRRHEAEQSLRALGSRFNGRAEET